MTEPIEPKLESQWWRKNWLSYLELQVGECALTVSVHPNLILDFDNSGNLLGIEVIGPVNFAKDEVDRLATLRE